MFRAIGLASSGETYPGCNITDAEWEFIRAIEKYQRRFHRRYPTWREVLHVARCLGYRKVARPAEVDQLPVGDAIAAPTAEQLAQVAREVESQSSTPTE